MTAPVIRRAVAGDVAEILDLVAELDRHLLAADPSLWRPPPRTAAPVEDLVENGVTAVAALADGRLAGVVAGRVEERAQEPTCVGFIAHAVVREGWRRRGLGGRLVARVLDDFDAAGVRDVSLRYVVASREAASFKQERSGSLQMIAVDIRGLARQRDEGRVGPLRGAITKPGRGETGEG